MTAVLKLLGFVLFTAPAFALPPGILRGFPGVEEGSATCTPGLYAKGCGQEVSVCTEEGKVVELVCPFSLWFDELAESCVPPADVTFCRAMDSSASILPSASLPSSFCDGLPNGFHPVSQCSTTMARCVNGTGSMFECPAGQVYMKGGCTNMDEAKECQNIANDDECSSDGLFEVDTCSPLFLACGSGLSHIMTCPWPLVFDPQTQVCNYDYEVDGCPLKPNTMCPADGFYSYGNCSDTFYACTGDFIQPMNCPAQLAFDGERKLCDYPKAVPECNNGSGEGSGDESGSGEASGESSGEASGESSGEASGESSGEESGFDSPYSSALNSNTCDNRADGFYADGCSSTLIGCSNGITNILYCPSKLAFDETRVLCDYPGAVDACRNQGSGSGEEGSGEEGSGTASGEGSGSGDVQQLDSPYASI